MLKRAAMVVAAAVVLALPAAYLLQPERGVPEGAPTQDAMAGSIGSKIMEHIYRGHVAGRSGEVFLVPKPHNYLIGEWDLRTLGTNAPTVSTSHPNPWDYLARVPIVLYGPGRVSAGLTVTDEVDIAQLAPTYARVLRLEDGSFEAPELPATGRIYPKPPPKLIFTVVIDGGGWNALQEHPDSWPAIRRLRARGTTYVNATIGSAPSITGALHATFGTGVYPRTHRIPGNQMRGPDGENTDAYLENADPRYLEVPTVSELWDESNDNMPLVGTVSYEGWHLGMIGHGAQRSSGDKDFAVLWRPATEGGDDVNEWWVNEEYYALPEAARKTDLSRLELYESRLDARDGLVDDAWFGHPLVQLREARVRPGTPAFARLTGDLVTRVVRSEGFGRDPLTDFFWVEMKMPDYAGHAWNVIRPEEGDVLREVDRQIGRFVRTLDRVAGGRDYLFALSADHGQQPLPDIFGGWRINSKELERDIEARFGAVVEKVTTVDIFVHRDRLADEGFSFADIARYLGTYTLGDNIPDGATGADRVPEGRFDELLFAGAFATDYIEGLTPERLASFGPGDYPEADLTIGDD